LQDASVAHACFVSAPRYSQLTVTSHDTPCVGADSGLD